MKSCLLAVCILVAAPAFASEILGTFETVDGQEAFVVSNQLPQVTDAYVLFGKIWLEKDGKNFRIASNSQKALLDVLCQPYRDKYPYDYNGLEVKKDGILGLGGEKVYELTSDLRFMPSDDTIVIEDASCAAEMY
jgi:hypothetical protein